MDTTQKASLYKVLSNTQLQQKHKHDIQVHKQNKQQECMVAIGVRRYVSYPGLQIYVTR